MTDVLRVRAEDSPQDLRHPSLFINRELSWLQFNRRVLAEAQDPRTPLLERCKFLAIYSSNLDEFFQIRVAGLKQQLAVGYAERTFDGMTPEMQLRAIGQVVRELQAEASTLLERELIPELSRHGVELLDIQGVPERSRKALDAYFQANVFPVLTPLAVDPAHPFPYISNLSLSLAVTLRDDGGEERFARVKVPKILPRWVPLDVPNTFVPLEQVIGANLEALFPGVEIIGWSTFRITRNADLEIRHDEAEDLLSLIQEEVRNRKFGAVTRIEVSPRTPQAVRQMLLGEFSEEQDAAPGWLTADDVYEVAGLMDASDLFALHALDLPQLKDTPHQTMPNARLAGGRNMFEVLREGDVLLHHPYESFTTSVERFIQAAAEDPDVLAIKLTLYRTGGDASVARLLEQAAARGKQVAVLIELQARFDEENNIIWANRLEDAGVHVSYGVAGLKTHAKVMLVVRREGEGIRRYVHVGTGNYNPKTARLYTDYGLLSADPELAADLTELFNLLTGFGAPASFRRLITAPKGMRDRFVQMIRREAEHARAGRGGRIVAKLNAIQDGEIIAELYGASQAGVEIDLIVRGICCLTPGVPGVSDRIRVQSIIGRFLEHSRAFYFRNGGEEEVYIGSADWMPRNLDRRIEAAIPILDPGHRRHLRDTLFMMLEDNRQAWDLGSDGIYVQRRPAEGEEERASQRILVERAKS
jgi:polyphosphate kinase